MKTWHIHIRGQVQGVGFRPFVYLQARDFGLNGWVNNTIDGVHVSFNATSQEAHTFYSHLIQKAPALAAIVDHRMWEVDPTFFDNFQIIQSGPKGNASLLVTPDFGICPDCRREVQTEGNSRKGYAFITCTNCGPRYSIVSQLPYDRERTTMHDFTMCKVCKSEYENPEDRRYYSQTNSCPNCGVKLTLFGPGEEAIDDQQEIAERVTEAWKAGKIVAVKGIGGYLLTCDASNAGAITTLRKRKHRPSKPFALMFPDVASLKSVVSLNSTAEALMTSSVSPIVVADLRDGAGQKLALEQIAPGLQKLGVMLPYAPIFVLLLEQFAGPIVATSGNISDAPIVFQDEKAKSELLQIADFVLANDRSIVMPQDDSVVRWTSFKQQKIVVRRSRGLAPTYINPQLQLPEATILSMGAMLKSTFTLWHQGNTYISQYLGDLQHFDTQEQFEHTVKHFLALFEAQPQRILVDRHPEYAATQYGQLLAADFEIPVTSVQHHIAHFGAVLGEHNLLDANEPILGVLWDGTGLGEDGQIWGGEFFTYEDYSFRRRNHFSYFDFILGDKMPKEPRISALSACSGIAESQHLLESKFTRTEWQVYQKLLSRDNTLQTSSLGRIFDAVASLLGLMDVQTYEGEAAMKLEAMATRYFETNGLGITESYFREYEGQINISTKSLMAQIIGDLAEGNEVSYLAAKFHFSLVHLIKIIANHLKIKKIAFSGGVFQNGLLVDLLLHHLSGFELYFHRQLSPNDECISFGQLVCHQIQKSKQNNHVFSNSR